jgi:hypothetical protein
MALVKHKPTIEDRIQERADLQVMLKTELKHLEIILEWIAKNDKQIKKLQKKKTNKIKTK